MSFDYDKLARKRETGSQWTTYSDLFMVLSVVFLLLYVVSSLRNGTFGIQKHLEYQNLKKEVSVLKQQLRVYETLKEEHLETGATEEEKDTYNELMAQLKLLKNEAKDEKEQLRFQAFENEKKEKALNKYQKIIKSIIETNMIAQSRIKKRDSIIENKEHIIQNKDEEIKEKDQTIIEHDQTIKKQKWMISQKKKEIKDKEKIIEQKQAVITRNQQILSLKQKEIGKLNKTIEEKKQIIAKNTDDIQTINSKLKMQMNQLKVAYRHNKMTKAAYQAQLAELQNASQNKIKKLETSNQKISSQLSNANKKLNLANNQIENANKTIEHQKRQSEELYSDLNTVKNKYQYDLAKIEQEKNDSLKELERTKQEEIAAIEQRKQQEIDSLRNQKENERRQYYAAIEDEKKRNQKEQARYLASVKTLQNKNLKLSSSLRKAQDNIETKKQLISSIRDGFRKAGIHAEVDEQTGDVTLSFKDEYFDTNESTLKASMKSTLKKFIPTYSSSLFSDPKIAQKIQSVEIVGFASPTYQGKYVDPQSLNPDDRIAVDYNLNLSFERAKSIFNYIFDTNQMQYPHQKTLLPMVKVTGRSYLAEGAQGRTPSSGISQKQYCKQHNCLKSQRVIVRFNLKD